MQHVSIKSSYFPFSTKVPLYPKCWYKWRTWGESHTKRPVTGYGDTVTFISSHLLYQLYNMDLAWSQHSWSVSYFTIECSHNCTYYCVEFSDDLLRNILFSVSMPYYMMNSSSVYLFFKNRTFPVLKWDPWWQNSFLDSINPLIPYGWASLVAQLVKNLPAMWETWVRFLG